MHPRVKHRSWTRQRTAASPNVQFPNRNHRYRRIASQLHRIAMNAFHRVSEARGAVEYLQPLRPPGVASNVRFTDPSTSVSVFSWCPAATRPPRRPPAG